MTAQRLVFDVLRENSRPQSGEWYQLAGQDYVRFRDPRERHLTVEAALVLSVPRIETSGPAGSAMTLREYLDFRRAKEAGGGYTASEARLVLTIEKLLDAMVGEERLGDGE